jgi:hypothetical protein
MDANIILLFYIVPLLFGTLLLTSFGSTIGASLSANWPHLESTRRQRLLGLNVVLLVGFAISVHTL